MNDTFRQNPFQNNSQEDFLEDELIRALDDVLNKTRYRDIMQERLGLNGQSPITLAEAGKRLGVSRERARQIERNATQAFQERLTQMDQLPVLNTVIKLLQGSAPLSIQRAQQLMQDGGLVRKHFDIQAILSATQAMGVPMHLHLYTIQGMTFLAQSEEQKQAIKAFFRSARDLAGANGAFEVTHAIHKSGQDLTARVARHLLKEAQVIGYQPLDTEQGWWTNTELPAGRDRLRNILNKILSVTENIAAQSVHDAVDRLFTWRAQANADMAPNLRVPPTHVIQLYCQVQYGFETTGDRIEAFDVLTQQEQLNNVEQAIMAAFRHHDTTVLDRPTLAREAFHSGIDDAWFSAALAHTPIIESGGHGLWKIRGRPAREADEQRFSQHEPVHKRVLATGVADNGLVWVDFRAPYSPKSTPISMPRKHTDQVPAGQFKAYLINDRPAGSLTKNDKGVIYGFYSAMKQLGAQEGNCFRVWFNTETMTALIEKQAKASVA